MIVKKFELDRSFREPAQRMALAQALCQQWRQHACSAENKYATEFDLSWGTGQLVLRFSLLQRRQLSLLCQDPADAAQAQAQLQRLGYEVQPVAGLHSEAAMSAS